MLKSCRMQSWAGDLDDLEWWPLKVAAPFKASDFFRDLYFTLPKR